MAKLNQLVNFLDQLLEASRYRDIALNGLQIESSQQDISRIAFAVDSGLSIVDKALEHNVQLLVVHHGVFWGKPCPLTGVLGTKLQRLFTQGCSLYASHLPLDGSLEVGNAAEFARHLELTDVTPHFEYEGATVGVTAQTSTPIPLKSLVELCAKLPGCAGPTVFPFGAKQINKVGIVTGSGGFALEACHASGIELLISGEPKHEHYHLAQELGLNAVFAGHYTSERFGVLALEQKLKMEFKIETVFIEESSGV